MNKLILLDLKGKNNDLMISLVESFAKFILNFIFL